MSLHRQPQHDQFHVPDFGEQPIPLGLIAISEAVELRIDGLVSEADASTTHGMYPLGLQVHKEHQSLPVLWPDFYRVFPVILWLAALCDIRVGFESGNYCGFEFPKRPSAHAAR